MRSSGRHLVGAALVLVGLATGCGTRVGNRLFAARTTVVPITTTSTAVDPATATAQISANWARFFQPGLTLAQREALLENGAQYAAALNSLAGNPLQSQARAVVHQVTLIAPDRAAVTYDVLLNGKVALPGAAGAAVLQDGAWKISDQSFCSLVTLTGKVPGC